MGWLLVSNSLSLTHLRAGKATYVMISSFQGSPSFTLKTPLKLTKYSHDVIRLTSIITRWRECRTHLFSENETLFVYSGVYSNDFAKGTFRIIRLYRTVSLAIISECKLCACGMWARRNGHARRHALHNYRMVEVMRILSFCTWSSIKRNWKSDDEKCMYD